MRTLIIIPAYNEEKNLGNLIGALRELKENINILVVNDCSKDKTYEVCKSLNVTCINLPCNLGIGGAVQTGYKYALKHNYDIAIQIDGDGQHDPSYIKDVVRPIVEEGADLVIGSRFITNEGFQSTFTRRLGIKYFSLILSRLSGKKITDPTSGFRACGRRTIEYFAKVYPRDYPEPESIMHLSRLGHSIKEVPVIMKERGQGQSSITSMKSVYYMVKVSLAILIDYTNVIWLKGREGA